MRLAQLLGGGVVIAVSAAVLLRALGPRLGVAEANGGAPGGAPAEALPGPAGAGLLGLVEAPGIELEGLEIRCAPIAAGIEGGAASVRADAAGRFEIGALLDTDYRIELVSLVAPELVLARLDFVRPGGDELVLSADPLALARLRKLRAGQ